MIDFDYDNYSYDMHFMQEEFETEHPDEEFEDTLHPVEISETEEQTLSFAIMEFLDQSNILKRKTWLKFRPQMPSIFKKFLADDLDICTQEQLEVAIDNMACIDDCADFYKQITEKKIIKGEGGSYHEMRFDFKQIALLAFVRFRFDENKLEKKINQHKICMLLKDRGENEMEKFVKSGRCPCGVRFQIEEEDDLDAQLFNDAHRRSKRHRDKLFRVCQYLWKTDDVIEVLKMTRLRTADMTLINLVLSFLAIHPLKLSDYGLVDF